MTAKLQRIVVPLDGSRLAESVLAVVTPLARCLGAVLCLLHIVEEHPPQTVHGEPHITSAAGAEDYLRDVARRTSEGIRIEQHVHATGEHDVAASIAQHVEELDAGMVALCTHGRGGPQRVVVGSIGQKVLRRVKVPVLLAQSQGKNLQPLVRDPGCESAISNIMVPVDGTHSMEEALSVATKIALACGSTLHLIRIVPTAGTVTGDDAASARLLPITTAAALDVEEEQAEQHLAALAEELRAGGVTARAEVRRGDRIQELAQAAAGTGADLIVIATHGRSGLGALWAGSVAHSLISKVPQPLMLVQIADTSIVGGNDEFEG